MFQTDQWRDELQGLQSDVSHVLNATSEGIFDASKQHAEALADRIRAAMHDLGEAISQEEDHLGHILSDRPVTTLASAFALGVVVGALLRSRP